MHVGQLPQERQPRHSHDRCRSHRRCGMAVHMVVVQAGGWVEPDEGGVDGVDGEGRVSLRCVRDTACSMWIVALTFSVEE